MTSESDGEDPAYWAIYSHSVPKDLMRVKGGIVQAWHQGRWVDSAVEFKWLDDESTAWQRVSRDSVKSIKRTIDDVRGMRQEQASRPRAAKQRRATEAEAYGTPTEDDLRRLKIAALAGGWVAFIFAAPLVFRFLGSMQEPEWTLEDDLGIAVVVFAICWAALTAVFYQSGWIDE